MHEALAVAWSVAESNGIEVAFVELSGDSLAATGHAVAAKPEPYGLRYELETGPHFVTRRLRVSCAGAGWSRALEMTRDPSGGWRTEPAGSPPELSDALDCDLARSPLTNTMPVLRHRLLQGPGSVDLVMAWLSVPDLTIHRSSQRYTHLRRLEGGGAVVRFESGSFRADIEFDGQGLVTTYPGLGRRIV